MDRKSPESAPEGLGGLRTGKYRPEGRGAFCKGFATVQRGCSGEDSGRETGGRGALGGLETKTEAET